MFKIQAPDSCPVLKTTGLLQLPPPFCPPQPHVCPFDCLALCHLYWYCYPASFATLHSTGPSVYAPLALLPYQSCGTMLTFPIFFLLTLMSCTQSGSWKLLSMPDLFPKPFTCLCPNHTCPCSNNVWLPCKPMKLSKALWECCILIWTRLHTALGNKTWSDQKLPRKGQDRCT